METADIFLKAAEALERYGHAKGVQIDSAGRMCLVGALNWGSKTGWSRIPEEDLNVLAHHAGIAASAGDAPVLELVGWNNAEERTGQEVIDAFRGAARELKAQQAEKVEIPEPVSA